MPELNTKPNIRLALYQPDIAQNVGTMIRMASCLGIGVDVIEPCGFVWGDKQMKRSAMDYLQEADITRHLDYDDFMAQKNGRRVILLTTKADQPYTDFQFQTHDILMVGQESAGVPENVHADMDARVIIPMMANVRSVNVALSASMVMGESLRQTGQFQPLQPKP